MILVKIFETNELDDEEPVIEDYVPDDVDFPSDIDDHEMMDFDDNGIDEITDVDFPSDDMYEDVDQLEVYPTKFKKGKKSSDVVRPITQDSDRTKLLRDQMKERVNNCINGDSDEHLQRPHRVLMFQQTHRNVDSIEKGRYNAPTASNSLLFVISNKEKNF